MRKLTWQDLNFKLSGNPGKAVYKDCQVKVDVSLPKGSSTITMKFIIIALCLIAATLAQTQQVEDGIKVDQINNVVLHVYTIPSSRPNTLDLATMATIATLCMDPATTTPATTPATATTQPTATTLPTTTKDITTPTSRLSTLLASLPSSGTTRRTKTRVTYIGIYIG